MKKNIKEDKVEIVIQINGKKRLTIQSNTDSTEKLNMIMLLKKNILQKIIMIRT